MYSPSLNKFPNKTDKSIYLKLTNSWEKTEANPYAVQELKDLLGGKHPANTGLRIYIGEKGDKSIRKFTRQIPNQKEGYYLSINNKEIILAGNDERGTLLCLANLKTIAQR